MGVKISGRYTGNLKTELQHEDSGSILQTAAPKDNAGDGSAFSPTDLLAASLASCVVTTIAIGAERKGIDISGAYFSIEKEMNSDPRRIGKLPFVVHLPRRLTIEERERVEAYAKGCPVHRSLHPDIEAPLAFFYDVE